MILYLMHSQNSWFDMGDIGGEEAKSIWRFQRNFIVFNQVLISLSHQHYSSLLHNSCPPLPSLFWAEKVFCSCEKVEKKSSDRHFTNKTRKWKVYTESKSFVHLNLEINYSENWPKSLNDGVQDTVFSVVRKTNCPPLNLPENNMDKGANWDDRTDRYRSHICLWM